MNLELLLPIIHKFLDHFEGTVMTIFILLASFIFIDSLRYWLNADAFYLEHLTAIRTAFLFFGIFPVSKFIIRSSRRFDAWLSEMIQKKSKFTEQEQRLTERENILLEKENVLNKKEAEFQELLSQNQLLKKEIHTLQEKLRKDELWKNVPIAGKI